MDCPAGIPGLTLHRNRSQGKVRKSAPHDRQTKCRFAMKNPTRKIRAGLAATQIQLVHVFPERLEIQHYWSPLMHEGCDGMNRILTIDVVNPD
jgi:hypothetical protein